MTPSNLSSSETLNAESLDTAMLGRAPRKLNAQPRPRAPFRSLLFRPLLNASLLPLSFLSLLLCASLAATDVVAQQRRGTRRGAATAKTSAKSRAQAKQQAKGSDAADAGAKDTGGVGAQNAGRTITVQTKPRAAVWLDDLRWGTTDEAGQLLLKNVPAGRHTLRVRATGFRERSVPLLPAQRGTLQVTLTPTTDEAELAFQQAEDAREGVVGPDGKRADAAALYRRAIELRPRFPEAHVGLARVLMSRDQYDEALEEIEAARRLRPGYAEASAVEGRILRAGADPNAAILSYRRAIREGRGVQPEAYAGLGIVYEEKGQYEEAVAAFRKAISQLYDTEPALYQLLGAAYEKLERWKDAVVAYEKYLALAPEGRLAPAIRSIIDQLRQQAAEQEQTQPR